MNLKNKEKDVKLTWKYLIDKWPNFIHMEMPVLHTLFSYYINIEFGNAIVYIYVRSVHIIYIMNINMEQERCILNPLSLNYVK